LQKILHNSVAIVFSVFSLGLAYQVSNLYTSGQNSATTHSQVAWQQSSGQSAQADAWKGAQSVDPAKLVADLRQNGANQPRVLGASTTYAATTGSENNISSDFANNIILPAVSQILVNYNGNFNIPDFDIDLKTLTLTPRADLPVHSVPETNQYVWGTGFAINSDGYFVTNSHVISKHELESDVYNDVKTHFDDVYQYEFDNLNKQQSDQLNAYYDSTYGPAGDPTGDAKFAQDISDQIGKYITANIKDDITQQIVVLNPSIRSSTASLDKGKELDEMLQRGLPATIVSYNDNYNTDQKDVAILKVDQNNLPNLTLSSADDLQVGKPVTVFGFPANAEIDATDFQPSETQGIISSVKSLDGMKLYQLDAKISEGSSGSPVINNKGEVVGITTLVSTGSGFGDNFGYALPISVIRDAMVASNVQNPQSPYDKAMLAALGFQNQQFCRKANAQFDIAKAANDKFIPTDQINSYINSCQALIASGKSLDSTKDIVINYVKTQKAVSISVLAVLLLLLAAGGYFLLRVLRRHSEEQASTSANQSMPIAVTAQADQQPMPPIPPQVPPASINSPTV